MTTIELGLLSANVETAAKVFLLENSVEVLGFQAFITQLPIINGVTTPFTYGAVYGVWADRYLGGYRVDASVTYMANQEGSLALAEGKERIKIFPVS